MKEMKNVLKVQKESRSRPFWMTDFGQDLLFVLAILSNFAAGILNFYWGAYWIIPLNVLTIALVMFSICGIRRGTTKRYQDLCEFQQAYIRTLKETGSTPTCKEVEAYMNEA